MKGLRQMCTSAIFNTQRTPFPTNSPCTACKPRASTCTSFLSCYQHHQPLPNSRTRCQPCHLCPWHHSAPALSPASGSSVAVTFPLHFRTTSSGRSSSAQHSHHTPGWQQPLPTPLGWQHPSRDAQQGWHRLLCKRCSGGARPTSLPLQQVPQIPISEKLSPSTHAGNPASICLCCSCVQLSARLHHFLRLIKALTPISGH